MKAEIEVLSKELNRHEKIKVVSLIILAGFVAAVFINYILGAYFGLSYPYNTFLFTPADRFMDFFNTFKLSENLRPYFETNGREAAYFPFSYVLIYLFSLIHPRIIAFFIFIFIFISYFFWYCYFNLSAKGKHGDIKDVFIFTFLTYPFLFAVDRANSVILVFIFLSLFIHLYQKGETYISLLFLAIAIAMKGYPFLFVLILFSDKKYKEIGFTVLTVIVITLLSLFLFSGSIASNFSGLLRGLAYFRDVYAIGDRGLHFNSSLYGMIKAFLYKAYPNIFRHNPVNIASFLKIYSIFSIFISIIMAGYIIFFEKVFWKKILLITFLILLLPYVTGDYTLLLLFIPLFLFINYEQKSRNALLYIIIFSLLLIPKNYYYLSGDVSISVILNPLIIIIGIVVIIGESIIDKVRGLNK